jgi:hypothetical protein
VERQLKLRQSLRQRGQHPSRACLVLKADHGVVRVARAR